MIEKLTTIKEIILGEVRHRVIKRRRDMTYWQVREVRMEGKWCPDQVDNQNGTEASAMHRFYLATR